MSLEDNLGKISLYDAKKYFRKAQNVVFNYTEMEGKVREATNNEPWGASSTLMEQISAGTYNYREREEILGMIFRRFTEKTASEWRQIYKALQLLEYLIKHGSERFIDDSRANLTLIKMLESFHYTDSQGRDQGINVRNRAQELVKLLNNDDQIRAERKKARETSKKYKGVAGGAPSSYLPPSAVNHSAGFGPSTRHGISVSADFDSDEENAQPVRKYTSPKPDFEEYDPTTNATRAAPAGAKKDDDDLFSFNDKPAQEAKNTTEVEDDDDDDEFTDFQSAVTVGTAPAQSGVAAASLAGLYSGTGSSMFQPQVSHLPSTTPNMVTPAVAAESKASSDPFSSLFMNAKSTPVPKKSTSAALTAPVPSSTAATAATQEGEKEEEEEEDIFFGEMTSAPQKAAPSTDNKNNQELDLLSF